jgi:Tfp pilus assembly PilM family ATPase
VSKLVGVDIGATAVRAVEVTGVDADGFALISRIGIAPVPRGAVIAGRIRSPKDVSVSLVRALRAAGLPRHGFVLGLTSPDVALTTMMFPSSVRSGEREGAIRAMGRPLGATFGLEQSIISTYLAGTTVTPDGATLQTIGVSAALNEDVAALQTVCELARCSPRAIDLTGAGLLRALVRVNTTSGEIGSIVDIGASKVMVATRQGMYLRSLRTTVGAGDEITRAIASTARLEFDDAEQQKLVMRLTSTALDATSGYGMDDDLVSAPRRDPLEVALSGSVDMLVDAVAQSIEADAANFGSMSQGVTLTGGTALLQGFKTRLQSRLGVPVSIGRPWAEIERTRRNAAFFKDGKVDPRLLVILAPATGLALWKERP